MFCPKCGNSNDDSAKFCSSCGSALPQPVKDAPPPQTEIDVHSNPDEFYKAILGPKNQDYYLSHFSRFDNHGKVGASWHWPAFFVTFYWLLYRKMWLNALIYFLLPYLVMIPLGIIAAVAAIQEILASYVLGRQFVSNCRICFSAIRFTDVVSGPRSCIASHRL